MIPLGNSGLPNGYKRLEYIEAVERRKTTIYFDLPWAIGDKSTFEYMSTEPLPESGGTYPRVFGSQFNNGGIVSENGSYISGWHSTSYGEPTRIAQAIWSTGVDMPKRTIYANTKYVAILENGRIQLNSQVFNGTPKEPTSPILVPYQLFGWGKDGGSFIGRFYSFKHERKGMLLVRFIPALNPSGVPGMFDTVAKTFKKSATSTPFTAGMTLRQVRDINLPVPGTVNKLSLSIPCEVYNDSEAWGAIEAAQQKGWTFTFYWTDVVAYLTPQLNAIVGSGNYTISYNYQKSKLSLAFVLSVTKEQVDAVENLLESVLSSSIVIEIAQLPIDVTKVEYLESTKTQYITTDDSVTPNTGVRIQYKQRSSKVFVLEEAIGANNGSYFWFVPRMNAQNIYSQEFYYYTKSTANLKNWGQVIVEMNYKNSGVLNMQNLIGDTYSRNLPAKKDVVLSPLTICGRPQARFDGWIWSCEITEGQETISKFVPVLDNTGAPCMYDTVMRKPFYNSATTGPDFIAGMTMSQALNLANLPATGGSLTVSLPLEAAFDTNVQSALNTAANKGWTIIVQYRESELTTANIDADFLESTGTQYIDTELHPYIDTKYEIDAQIVSDTLSSHEALCGYRTTNNATLGFWLVNTNLNVCKGGAEITIAPLEYVLDRRIYKYNVSTASVGEYQKNLPAQSFNYEIPNFLLFAMYRTVSGPYVQSYARIWRAQFWDSENEYTGNFIPVIDSAGIPCMHDTVSGQNFYNANTAEGAAPFIVGFETTEKAAVSLSKLPITTAGTLTVSLPSAAQDTATLVPEAIDIATSRGWTIITQYRED